MLFICIFSFLFFLNCASNVQVYRIFSIWFLEQQSALEERQLNHSRARANNDSGTDAAIMSRKQYSIGLLFTVIKMLHILKTPHDVYYVVHALTHRVLPACYEVCFSHQFSLRFLPLWHCEVTLQKRKPTLAFLLGLRDRSPNSAFSHLLSMSWRESSFLS